MSDGKSTEARVRARKRRRQPPRSLLPPGQMIMDEFDLMTDHILNLSGRTNLEDDTFHHILHGTESCPECFGDSFKGTKPTSSWWRRLQQSVLHVASIYKRGVKLEAILIKRVHQDEFVCCVELCVFGSLNSLFLWAPKNKKGLARLGQETLNLQFVAQRLTIPITKVALMDLEYNRTRRLPYLVHWRQEGELLDSIWEELSQMQRVMLTHQIAAMIRQLFSEKAQRCSVISASYRSSTGLSGEHTFVTSRVAWPHRVFVQDFGTLATEGPKETTLQFIYATCERWKELERRKGQYRPWWDYLSMVAREWHFMGLLPDNEPFYLTHNELVPRHILVVRNNISVDILVMKGWHHALYAPAYVTCRPPSWLWHGLAASLPAHDLYEHFPTKKPRSEQELEIKALFDQVMGKEYCRRAYGEAYVMLRRMFFWLQYGIPEDCGEIMTAFTKDVQDVNTSIQEFLWSGKPLSEWWM
jgi:hypothetical protein